MLQEMITANELMTMDKGSTPLSLAARIFLLYNQSEGKAARTQEWYRLCMDRLILGFGPDMPVGGITEDVLRVHIVAYQEKAHSSTGKPLMASTINNHVRGIRRFFKWCYIEGYTTTQLLGRYTPPKVPERIVEPFKEAEIQKISDVCLTLRDVAILYFLIDTGIRAGELATVKVQDVDLEIGTAKVFGKGAKERIVPFGDRAEKAIIDYVLNERPEARGTDQLFLNPDGVSMKSSAVRQLFERLRRRSGIKPLHAHRFRHSFATSFLINGGDSLMLKYLLGHTTLIMVDRYVHIANMKAAQVGREFLPLDRMNLKQRRRVKADQE